MRNETKDQHYREIRRVTLVGAFIDLALGIAKIIVGFVGHSQSLMADGVHSLSDLGTDALVLLAAKHANREADLEHPYGHERVQTAATVLLGLALIAVAIGIAYDAILRLFEPESLQTPAFITLLIAALSVVLKEGIYHYTMRTARKIKSSLLRANAWHSRTDAFSSVIVMIGIAGTWAGLTYLDAIAAVLVAAMILHIGGKLVWDSFRELVDTGLEKHQLDKMRNTMQQIEGVEGIHQLRTRRMGAQALADVHIHVDPRISVSEGHRIGDEVIKRLIGDFEEVNEVMVHIDPENDDKGALSSHLPLRSVITTKIKQRCAEINPSQEIDRITLHYLDGKIFAALYFRLNHFENLNDAQSFSQHLHDAFSSDDVIESIEVNYF